VKSPDFINYEVVGGELVHAFTAACYGNEISYTMPRPSAPP